MRLSIDQKANLKSNSDHNTAEGGNRKKFQIASERTWVIDIITNITSYI